MVKLGDRIFSKFVQDLTCRRCKNAGSIEILQSEVHDVAVKFDDVYGDLNKQLAALTTFRSVLRKREVLLTYQNG